MVVEKFNIHGEEIEVCDEHARAEIGNEELLTNAKTLKGAINEVMGVGGSSVAIQYNEDNSSLIITTGGGA